MARVSWSTGKAVLTGRSEKKRSGSSEIRKKLRRRSGNLARTMIRNSSSDVRLKNSAALVNGRRRRNNAQSSAVNGSNSGSLRNNSGRLNARERSSSVPSSAVSGRNSDELRKNSGSLVSNPTLPNGSAARKKSNGVENRSSFALSSSAKSNSRDAKPKSASDRRMNGYVVNLRHKGITTLRVEGSAGARMFICDLDRQTTPGNASSRRCCASDRMSFAGERKNGGGHGSSASVGCSNSVV